MQSDQKNLQQQQFSHSNSDKNKLAEQSQNYSFPSLQVGQNADGSQQEPQLMKQTSKEPLLPDITSQNRSGQLSQQNNKLKNANQSGYNQEELRLLLELFNSYDQKQLGLIEVKFVDEILKKLDKSAVQLNEIILKTAFTKEGFLSFDEFLAILSDIEFQQQDRSQSSGFLQKRTNIAPDIKVLEFLRLLDDYRKKCEGEGNYTEAKKAHLKIQEINEKESLRQKNNLRFLQEEELINIEKLQRNQFIEFTNAWDKYMAEYEQTAYLSLEKLKDRHQKEAEEFSQQTSQELMEKIKYSKNLLELRHKEKLLVKMKQYAEAERVKAKADEIEQIEQQQRSLEIQETVELKVAGLRKQQQQILQALLKRIQSDRTQQLRQRQADSNRLIMKNRNIRNDLINKHNHEIKQAMDILKENMVINCNILQHSTMGGRDFSNKHQQSTITNKQNQKFNMENNVLEQQQHERHRARNNRSTSLNQSAGNKWRQLDSSFSFNNGRTGKNQDLFNRSPENSNKHELQNKEQKLNLTTNKIKARITHQSFNSNNISINGNGNQIQNNGGGGGGTNFVSNNFNGNGHGLNKSQMQ